MPIQFPSRDLTNQFISTSYQDVVQRFNSGSVLEYFLDGLGYAIGYIPSSSLGNQILTSDATASYSLFAISASFAPANSSVSSSYALSASYAVSASIANLAIAAKVADVAFLADTASIAAHADFATSASWASSSYTSSIAITSISSSWASSSISSSYALTSSAINILAINTSSNFYLTFATSSGNQQLYIDTSSIYYTPNTNTLFVNSITASSVSSSLFGTSSFANSSSRAISSSYSISSSYTQNALSSSVLFNNNVSIHNTGKITGSQIKTEGAFWLNYGQPLNTYDSVGNLISMIYVTNGAECNFGGSNVSNLIFNTGFVEGFRVVNNGNVLIGTTTDNGQKLQVAGKLLIKDAGGAAVPNPDTNAVLVLDSGNNATNFWANIPTVGTFTNTTAVFGISSNGGYLHGVVYNLESNYMIVTNDGGNGLATTGMAVDGTGSVGINTITPGAALDVNGNAHVSGDLTVDGTITGNLNGNASTATTATTATNADTASNGARSMGFLTYNGTTLSTTTYNATVTRGAIGQYNVLFTSVLPNANYVVQANGFSGSGIPVLPPTASVISAVKQTTTGFTMSFSKGFTVAAADFSTASFAVYSF